MKCKCVVVAMLIFCSCKNGSDTFWGLFGINFVEPLSWSGDEDRSYAPGDQVSFTVSLNGGMNPAILVAHSPRWLSKSITGSSVSFSGTAKQGAYAITIGGTDDYGQEAATLVSIRVFP